MDERRRRPPPIYCTAFLLVLAGPLWPHVPWKNTSTHPCISPLSFRTLWGSKTISSSRLERWKPETVCSRFPSVFIPHARGRLCGWQPPLCFFHNNCSLQIAHEICAESLCCPRTWPKPSSGLPRFSNSHDSESQWYKASFHTNKCSMEEASSAAVELLSSIECTPSTSSSQGNSEKIKCLSN